MSLYLDTSAIVKLYVREAGSELVASHLSGSPIAATSRVVYAEARAALARRHREGGLSALELRKVVDALDRDIKSFVTIEVSESLSMRAGQLADKHHLRGFDAIHLASALELKQLLGTDIAFLTFDNRQKGAAASEGLLVT